MNFLSSTPGSKLAGMFGSLIKGNNDLSGVGAAYSPFTIGQISNTITANTHPNVAADTTNSDPTGGADLGGTTLGGGGGGGTSAAAYNPLYDPSAIAALKGHISDRQNQANDLYNQLFSSIDSLANDRRNTLQSQYGTQFQKNDQNYNQAVDQTDGAFLGRGAYDSSFRGNAQGQNKQMYQNSNQELTDNENNGLASIGQFVDTQKQGINSSKPQYDLNQYTDVNQLQSLYDQLGQHIQGLQGQQAGLKTNSQYMQDLNSVTPQASNLSSQLSDQLSKLAQSSAPNDAKLAMVDAYITRNGQQGQKDYWQNYFMNLLNPQAQASQTPTAPVA